MSCVCRMRTRICQLGDGFTRPRAARAPARKCRRPARTPAGNCRRPGAGADQRRVATHAVVDDLHVRPVVVRDQAQQDRARARMLERVVERLLRGAEQQGLARVVHGRQRADLQADLRPAGLGLAARQPAQRRLQAQVVQDRRAQQARQMPGVLQGLGAQRDGAFHLRAQRRLRRPQRRAEQGQAMLEHGEVLADAVVQLARQAPAFVLLHLDHRAAQPAELALVGFQPVEQGLVARGVVGAAHRVPACAGRPASSVRRAASAAASARAAASVWPSRARRCAAWACRSAANSTSPRRSSCCASR